MWRSRIITEPAAEPVTLTEMKAHARVGGSADDAYLGACITAARQLCEQRTGRALITQTVELTASAFPCAAVWLPASPIQSVTSLKYFDGDDVEQTLSTTVYSVLTHGAVPLLLLKYGQAWPSTYAREDAITLRLVVGYGDDSDAVPAALKQWMLMYASGLYENREAAIDGQPVTGNPMLDGLLDPYRVVQVA